MIDIAILTCNRPRIHELCIKEIKARTLIPHRLVVVDNGTEDERWQNKLVSFFESGLIDELILLSENTGVHWGFNYLLGLVKSEPYYVCSDADLIPCSPIGDEDWISRLIKLADANPEFGAIACRPHVLIGGVPDWDESMEVIQVPWAGAALRLMRTEAVREAGGWQDVKRPSRNGEERWISDRLKAIGYKVGYARDIPCIHLFGIEGEDPWGYPIGMEHGHNLVWPLVTEFSWDKVGIDWKTCKSHTGT